MASNDPNLTGAVYNNSYESGESSKPSSDSSVDQDDSGTTTKADIESNCAGAVSEPNGSSLGHELQYDRTAPRKIKRYYKAQNELLNSIDDIHLNLEDYRENAVAKKTKISAQTVAKITFAINFVLFSAKLIAAVLSGSLAIISSVLDSAVDLVSGILLWWSSRAIKHVNHFYYPRGRRKLEPVAIVILSVIMSLASVQIIQSSIQRIVTYVNYDVNCHIQAVFNNESDVFCGTQDEIFKLVEHCMEGSTGPTVAIPTIVICCATIVIKLTLFLVCRNMKSPTIQALAQDHRNDVVSNSSALIFGFLGYKVWKYCDPIGAILIAIYIIVNWFITANEQIKMITGYTASPDVINKLTWVILQHNTRISYIDDLKAFHFGTNYIVEVDLVLPEEIEFRESHDIGETLQIKLEKLDEVERAFVHVDYECGYRHHLTRL